MHLAAVIAMSAICCSGLDDPADHAELNVALTRARRGLIVVGWIDTLCAGDTEGVLTDFVTECLRRGLLLTRELKPSNRTNPLRGHSDAHRSGDEHPRNPRQNGGGGV